MILRQVIKYLALILTIAVMFLFIAPYISAFLFFVFIFFAIFFRDPSRNPEGEGALSPADGTVKKVNGNTVEIFMGPFDCHINRSPLSGKVISIEHTPGKFKPAFREWRKNERRRTLIKTEEGDLEIVQIAGWFARRIVSFISEGENVERGQKIGMIIFGSRVHVTLPEGYEVMVREGDKVYAGKSVIAREINGSNG